MNSQEAQPPSNYLAHVGLIEGLREIRQALAAWLLITGVAYVVGLLWTAGALAIDVEPFWDTWDMPRWGWVTLIFGYFGWMLRGQTWRFPRFSFKGWAFSVAGVAAFGAICEYAPWWGSLPLFTALLCVSGVVEDLNALGREKYEQQKQQRQ